MKKVQRNAGKFTYLGIVIFLVLAHVISWKSQSAVDWYRLHIFPIWTNTIARVMSVFPFSVGEILIYCGIFLIIFTVIISIGSIFFKVGLAKIRRYTYCFLAWALIFVAVTETFNCFLLYHASTVEEQYYGTQKYTKEQLFLVYEELVTRSNELSVLMTRNEKGEVTYSGDMYAECKKAMQDLGGTYPYLKGYYPNPKRILASDFMSQQYLCGIYFPFTLESNYNSTMYIMNDAATICHEFSHLKGIILEDEANYFGFLACIQSDDAFLQYSGYLSVLNYAAREVKKYATEDEIKGLTKANEYVRKDIVFLTKESWDRVETKAVVSTETANRATDHFLSSNLKANGVSDGMISYSRVVRLLLDHYNGILWESENES